jgi:hypothetical protein
MLTIMFGASKALTGINVEKNAETNHCGWWQVNHTIPLQNQRFCKG